MINEKLFLNLIIYKNFNYKIIINKLNTKKFIKKVGFINLFACDNLHS